MKLITHKPLQLDQAGFDHILIGLFVVVIFGVIGTSLLVFSHAATATGTISGSGKCMDDYQGAAANGSPVVMWPCNSKDKAQLWTVDGDGTISIATAKGAACLDNWQAKAANGNPIVLYTCNTKGVKDPAEQWVGNKTSRLIENPASKMCIDYPTASKSNPVHLVLWSCSANLSVQKFDLPIGGYSVGSTASTSSICTSLTPMPPNSEPTGSAGVAWAECALDALGAPRTIANIQTMTTWFLNEGTPHDPNNPLNLQTPYGGSTISTADGDPAADRIQAYRIPSDFGAAFKIEMNNPSYPLMLSDLRSGSGMLKSTNSTLMSELKVYSGGGYNSIPAAYLQGQLGAQ